MTHPRRNDLKRKAMLALILVLAAVLRIRGIGQDSLWGDEGLSVMLAKMDVFSLIKYLTWWEQIPPIHHLVLHYWMMVFGDSETSLRMPSALAGITSVWMLYVLVARLLGRRVAMISALLLAVSPMHIAYSQECRAYSLSVLIGLWSCDLFVRLLRNPSPRLHTWYVVASILLIYTHVYGLFTILAQQLVWAWTWYRRKRAGAPMQVKPWIIDWLAIAALYSAWIPIVMRWTRMIHAIFWVKKVTFDDISRALWTYSGSTLVYAIMIALAVIGIYRFRRRKLALAMLLAILLVPIVVPVTISVLKRPSFAPRYAIMSTTAWVALSAMGIAAIKPVALRGGLLLALVVLCPLGTAAVIPRAQWRDIGDFLNQNMRPGDLAVCYIRASNRLYNYYVKRPDVRALFIDTGVLPVTLPLDPGRRVWLVMYDGPATPQQILARAPWRIERRKWTWGVMAMELTDTPWPDEAAAASQAATTGPVTAPSATSPAPSTATTRPTPTP